MITVKKPTEDELRDFLTQKFLEEQFGKEAEENNSKSLADYKQRLMRVTPTLFRKFLAEKGAAFHCLSCGSNELTVPESTTLQSEKLPDNFSSLPDAEREMITDALIRSYVSYVTWGDESRVSGLRKSYYQVHCLNCGHLSLYRSVAVLHWLENIDKAGEKE
jgi:predicted nucleic-acid-binding Zn-ribbon protein